MFYYTYVLECYDDTDKRSLYVGYCSELEARVKQHAAKAVAATKRFKSISLIYYEACLSKTDAIKREMQLKSGFGRGYLNKRLGTFISLRD